MTVLLFYSCRKIVSYFISFEPGGIFLVCTEHGRPGFLMSEEESTCEYVLSFVVLNLV